MNGNVVETIIGAIVVAVAVAFVAFAYSKTDVGAVSGYELQARFNNATGITVGTDVRMSGIKVGTVTNQSLDTETYQAVLTLSIADDIKLPLDTALKIASDGLLGGAYLALEPGGEIDMLAAGEEIEYTQGAVDIVDLLGKAIFAATGSGDDKAAAGAN